MTATTINHDLLNALYRALDKQPPPYVGFNGKWYTSKVVRSILPGLDEIIAASQQADNGHVTIQGQRPSTMPGRHIQCRYVLYAQPEDDVLPALEHHDTKQRRQSLGIKAVTRAHLKDTVEVEMRDGRKPVPGLIKDGLAVAAGLDPDNEIDFTQCSVIHVRTALCVYRSDIYQVSPNKAWRVLHALLEIGDWDVDDPKQTTTINANAVKAAIAKGESL